MTIENLSGLIAYNHNIVNKKLYQFIKEERNETSDDLDDIYDD